MSLIIVVQNDGTGDVDKANYDWRAYVNDTMINSGRVENHYRKDGWEQLVRRVANAAESAKYKTQYEIMTDVYDIKED